MKTTAIRSAIWIFAIAICASPLPADGPQTSTIDGTVTDAQGDALPGVSVTLTGPQNTRTEITDANGDYRFALLQAGSYTVTADLEGLGSAERAVSLELGKREDVDLTLGATAEEITVTSEAALITKYDTGSVAALGEEELEHVPQATRNYWSNMKLMAGVVSQNQEFDQSPGVNGGIGQENVLFIGQNPAWRAENWLEMERPDSMINSYETGLGGPLFRDKAWFYASLSEMNDNRLDLTRDGNPINTNRTAEPLVGKVNTQPNDRHQLALTLIDSPSGRLNPPGSAGDIYSVTRNSWNNRIQTLTWSFALTDSAFLEAKAANRELVTARIGSPPAEILPGASPDTPDGNNLRYRDLADGRRYNAPVNRLGAGGNDFPRDQANASLTFFRGKHEFKGGIDVQDVTFATITSIGTEYRGRGYGRSLPGGYASPVNKRVFDCPVPCNTAFTSGIGAAYVQETASRSVTTSPSALACARTPRTSRTTSARKSWTTRRWRRACRRSTTSTPTAGCSFGHPPAATTTTSASVSSSRSSRPAPTARTPTRSTAPRRAPRPPGLLRRALLQGRDLGWLRLAVLEQLGLQVARDLVGYGEHVPQHPAVRRARRGRSRPEKLAAEQTRVRGHSAPAQPGVSRRLVAADELREGLERRQQRVPQRQRRPPGGSAAMT